MLAPVVREYAARHTDDELWVMSKPFHAPLFEGMAPNVHFLAKDPKKDYKGIRGLYRLFRELDAMHFDLVIDEHDVLRTKFLRKLFRLHGYKVSHINKHRSLRRKITAPEGKKELFRLPTAFENYAMALGEPLSEKRKVKSEKYHKALDASSEKCRVKSEKSHADDIQSNGNLNSSLFTLNFSLKSHHIIG